MHCGTLIRSLCSGCTIQTHYRTSTLGDSEMWKLILQTQKLCLNQILRKGSVTACQLETKFCARAIPSYDHLSK